jgi:hypothetical protein
MTQRNKKTNGREKRRPETSILCSEEQNIQNQVFLKKESIIACGGLFLQKNSRGMSRKSFSLFQFFFRFFLWGFALIGLFLVASWVAIQLKWTVEGGTVDGNNRYFQDMQDKYNQSFAIDTSRKETGNFSVLGRILFLSHWHPANADAIFDIWKMTGNDADAHRMLDAAELQMAGRPSWESALNEWKRALPKTDSISQLNAFPWMNIMEWQDFKVAVAKDKKVIDSVARQTGVEARLIVACLVGEQIRLFNSDREAYKKWIGPLKILSVESTFSFGVTGIKDETAQTIERYTRDSTSAFYTGKDDEHWLDFHSDNHQEERYKRLTHFKNHYYSYLYAALFLKQVKTQWEKAGHPIDERPEILATLFNVGFARSLPKANPQVGGATITIRNQPYTFGAIAYQFYYSGELFDLFPYQHPKFRPA